MCEKTVIFVGNAAEASSIKSDRRALSFHCGSSLRTTPFWCFATSGSDSVANVLEEGVPTHLPSYAIYTTGSRTVVKRPGCEAITNLRRALRVMPYMPLWRGSEFSKG